MTTDCHCSCPGESVNPRKKGSCVACGRGLGPDWISSDATMARLFQRLEEACPPGEARRIGPNGTYELTDQFLAFKAECLARESRGRDEFGLKYLRRDGGREAMEEASDGAIYLFLDSLRAIRDNGTDEDIDIVLVGAYHAYKLYEACLRLRARRHGAP